MAFFADHLRQSKAILQKQVVHPSLHQSLSRLDRSVGGRAALFGLESIKYTCDADKEKGI
jgi:hypothetical protein